MLISFGYDKGSPPRALKIFDVRDLGHVTSAPDFKQRVVEICDAARAHPGQTIAVGCAKGRHRSPEIVNRVAEQLRTSKLHRDS